jgi:hypothetical protein
MSLAATERPPGRSDVPAGARPAIPRLVDRRAGAGRRSASVVGVHRLVVFSLALSMVAYGMPEGAVADDDWRWMVRYEMRFGGEPRSHRVNFLATPGSRRSAGSRD